MASSKEKNSRGAAVVVLGMHRSGTSILTRALQAHGCALSSELLGANPSNPSGHWESSVAISINDKMLADLGRSWDDLRELPPAWMQGPEAQEAKARIKILLDGDFRNERLWAIKEPRMCRLAPLWIEAITELGFEAKVVMAVRHPREVALSLLRRDGMPTAHGVLLWTQYMLDAEAATRGLRRVVVGHQQISGDWRSTMARVGMALGVEWPASEAVAAEVLDQVISVDNVNINKTISRSDPDGDLVPQVCEALYEKALQAGSGAGQWSEFIAIADEFKALSKVYGPVVNELYRDIQACRSQRAENEAWLQQIAQLVPMVSQVADGIDQAMNQSRDHQASLLSKIDRSEQLESTIASLQSDLEQSSRALVQANSELMAYVERATNAENELRIVYASWSMRLTWPLRGAKAILGGLGRRIGSVFGACAHLIREPGRYLRIAVDKQPGEVLALVRGFIARGGPKPVAPEPAGFNLRSVAGPVIILATRHCQYIAREIHDALERVGIGSEIIFERPASGYADVPHFVICPQMFSELPGFYVAFQMEQSVSSRWFNADYLRMLESSFAVFDYSTTNIAFLKDSGLNLKQIYYVPVGPLPGILPEGRPADHTDEAEYDVVFYGDANNERRQKYLQELGRRYRVKVVSEVFGEELYRILARAKLVVNIHYYAGALLETTRIWECLSLGKLVVSERSSDMDEHGDLDGIVDFVEIDDIQALVDRVGHWLRMDSEREQRIQDIRSALSSGLNRFDYFFFRFLLATDNITFDEFWREAGSKFELTSDRLCLNLPEYTDRSKDFSKDNKYGFSVLPGLRHSKGWIGCALSYKYMIMLARKSNLESILICEDDVEFPADFDPAMASINRYLASCSTGWDVFSGLMADLHKDAKIFAVDDHEGRTFVTTDRLISTVMNVYNRSVFDLIAGWNENDRDVETNTIDRYLERNSQLKVVVTEPFLVGHKEEQHSTIWGFQNTQYAEMIIRSNDLLRMKADAFLRQ